MAQLTPQFFQTILKIEGGYQNRADDSGNYACGQQVGTKYGISAGAYQTWTGRCPTIADMQALTTSDAQKFYAWYFHVYNLYQIESQKLFELCANNTMGSPSGAAKAEQRALNRLGFNVAVDGSRGPQTIAALNAAWKKDPAGIYNAIRDEWVKYLNSINKPQFLAGWIYRLNTYFPALPVAAAASGAAAIAILVAAILILKK